MSLRLTKPVLTAAILFLSTNAFSKEFKIRISNEDTARKLKLTWYCNGVKEGSKTFPRSKKQSRVFNSNCSYPGIKLQAKIVDKWNKVQIWHPNSTDMRNLCDWSAGDTSGTSCGTYVTSMNKVNWRYISDEHKACFRTAEVFVVRATATKYL